MSFVITFVVILAMLAIVLLYVLMLSPQSRKAFGIKIVTDEPAQFEPQFGSIKYNSGFSTSHDASNHVVQNADFVYVGHICKVTSEQASRDIGALTGVSSPGKCGSSLFIDYITPDLKVTTLVGGVDENGLVQIFNDDVVLQVGSLLRLHGSYVVDGDAEQCESMKNNK